MAKNRFTVRFGLTGLMGFVACCAMLCWVVGKIGRAAECAVPALQDRLQDKHPTVRIVAAEALERIDLALTAEPAGQ